MFAEKVRRRRDSSFTGELFHFQIKLFNPAGKQLFGFAHEYLGRFWPDTV